MVGSFGIFSHNKQWSRIQLFHTVVAFKGVYTILAQLMYRLDVTEIIISIIHNEHTIWYGLGKV